MLGCSRTYGEICISVLIVFAALNWEPHSLSAHSPHDVINSLALSPDYPRDQTLFVVVWDQLRKSINGGRNWKHLVNGLDHASRVHAIALSPAFRIDQTVFVSTDGDGIYKSVDGGISWRKVNRGLPDLHIGILAVSPQYHADRTVLAAGRNGKLYKTENGGEGWFSVFAATAPITALAFGHKGREKPVYMGDSIGHIYESRDAGKSWRQRAHLRDSGAITALAPSVHLATPHTLWSGTEKRGILQSLDGGASFVEANQGLSDKRITAIVIPLVNSNDLLFASTWQEGVFRSDDGGRVWQRRSQGLTTDQQADSLQLPHFLVLQASTAFEKNRTLYVAGFDGLFKTTDDGQAWQELQTFTISRIEGLALSPVYSQDKTLSFSTYRGGAYLSEDAGTTWKEISSSLPTRLFDVAFSPNFSADQTVFIGSFNDFFRSADKGKSWELHSLPSRDWYSLLDSLKRKLQTRASSALGHPPGDPASRWLNVTAWLAGSDIWIAVLDLIQNGWQRLERLFELISYALSHRLTLRPQEIVISPAFASDRTIFVSTERGRIYRSVDAGKNWSTVWRNKGRGKIALVISPNFAADQTLYAGIQGEGIYKTTDKGETWHFIYNANQDASYPLHLLISPSYRADQTLLASAGTALLVTTDEGRSWDRIAFARSDTKPTLTALAISSSYAQDKEVLVSLKGIGLLKYDKRTQNFVTIGTGLIEHNHNLRFIKFSPSYAVDHTLYGASEEELFRSTDRGKTWAIVPRPVIGRPTGLPRHP
jgi:photosystem II stability/assembly factor-like uncharacterized protein